MSMTEQIQITTKDCVKIAGDYYSASSKKGILLLHMMPATKESWAHFSGKLQESGFNVLAIDLRGHGKSGGLPAGDLSKAGPDGYRKFSDTEHQSSINDVTASVEFLKEKGISEIYIGGASIGANLALQYVAEHKEINKIILLSAGLNYYGIITKPLANKLQKDQNVYFIGDEDDVRKSGDSAADMAKILFDITTAKKEIKIFKGSEHGTDVLIAHAELEDELINWLSK